MKEIIFFSNNNSKKLEISKLLENIPIKILNLNDFDKIKSPKETGRTFEENAKIKSIFGLKIFKRPCFADDSGICIDAMNNKPGINSKKFLERNVNTFNVFNKIILFVNKAKNNKAFFQTSICLSINSNTHFTFNGNIKGTIARDVRGRGGFGYDPIFIPIGKKYTFGEISSLNKYKMDHRFQAFKKIKKFL